MLTTTQDLHSSQIPAASGGVSGAAPGTDQILQDATATFRRLLNFRRPYDALRLQYYQQYLSKKQAAFFPDNITRRSNTTVPYAWSNVEEINARVQDAFFQIEPWIEVRPTSMVSGPASEAMETILLYMLRKAEFPRAFEAMVRNCLMYGHGALKVDWDWDFDTITVPMPIPAIDPATGQPIIDPSTGQPIIRGYVPQTKQIPRMCPKFTAIDIYDFLVDPDGGITAHLVEKTWGQMKREVQAKPDLYFPEAIQQIENFMAGVQDPDSYIIRFAEIWNDFTKTCTIITTEDRDAIAYKDTRAAIRSTGGYTPYKRNVFLKQPILLWHGSNQFMHQKSPVLHTGYIKIPNEVYGVGCIEPSADTNDALDRFLNMITDNWNLGINRRYAYDANAEIDHEALNSFNVPGGKVGVLGNPNDVIAPLPFFTPNAGDYQILSVYKEFIELSSGVSDFYSKGVGTGGDNSTASGINSIIQESTHRFKLFIRNLELDIVRPMLNMVAAMVQQFTTDQFEMMLLNAPPAIQKLGNIAPESLIGSYEFDIAAANYTSNKTIRQRNMLAFVNFAASTPYWNQYEGLKEIAKIFDIRNAARLLNDPMMVQMNQQQNAVTQMKMELLSKLLDIEGKMLVQEARTVSNEGDNPGQNHALKTQEIIEQYLTTLGELPGQHAANQAPHSTPVGNTAGDGRPRSAQMEGPIPGMGSSGMAREIGQARGKNAMGLAGLEPGQS